MVTRPDVRAQIAAVFHLDKCVGCHTCSVACKNIWTDREGAEYMWWNNVETKPGTGYPTQWEDQDRYRGGFQVDHGGRITLRGQSRLGGLLKLFYNPNQPGLDDYYEPWTYRYADLFDAPAAEDQPTARPISLITGQPIAVEAGPNWDDDLSGSPVYAEQDVNLAGLTPAERRAMFEVEQMAMMYLPRICNHCVHPACVAACPSGAIYKRGEDGIVLINQQACRGWRACVPACPYKKAYFNWRTGKSEKCILCYPRLESGQAPACFHSCVGRIRYLGVLLYDASRVREAVSAPLESLVEAQRSVILDPRDPSVAEAASRNGVTPETIDQAKRSPVWRFVKEWELALPLHPEFRTFPMVFYVPPLLPARGRRVGDLYEPERGEPDAAADRMRLSFGYLSRLFGAGNPQPVEKALRRLLAVTSHQRAKHFGQTSESALAELRACGLDPAQADAIYHLTALCDHRDRFVVPPLQREDAAAGGPGRTEQRAGAGRGLVPSPGGK